VPITTGYFAEGEVPATASARGVHGCGGGAAQPIHHRAATPPLMPPTAPAAPAARRSYTSRRLLAAICDPDQAFADDRCSVCAL